MVFDELWFRQNQWWLLPYVSHDRDNLFIGTNKPLLEIAPDHVTWLEEPGLLTTEFHVHQVYGRRLYRRLEPLWNVMHRIDMSTWGRAVGLNFGFDTLTVYPDAHTETDTVDGRAYVYVPTGDTWHNLVVANASGVADSETTGFLYDETAYTAQDRYTIMQRGIFLFKTSTLTADATISAATISFYSYGKQGGLGSDALHLVSSNPYSNTALSTHSESADDYKCLGSTSFGTIAYADYPDSGYGSITLNSSGLATIAKTGISKFGTRSAWDLNDYFNGIWASRAESYLCSYMADDTTANNGKDPKLVVTYTVPSKFIPQIIII